MATEKFTVVYRQTEDSKQQDADFDTKDEAITYAESLPEDYDWIEVKDPEGVTMWDKAEGEFEDYEGNY